MKINLREIVWGCRVDSSGLGKGLVGVLFRTLVCRVVEQLLVTRGEFSSMGPVCTQCLLPTAALHPHTIRG
jgi:hypothetical protein